MFFKQIQQTILSRRQILQALSSVTAAGALSAILTDGLSEAATRSNRNVHFGAQTNAWAIDPKNFSSLIRVLHTVRQIGYAGFETGFRNVITQFQAPAEARQEIEKIGLTFFGMHVFLPRDQYDQTTNLPPASLYRKIAPGGMALGAQHLIFSGAPVNSQQQLYKKISGLNEAGKYCRSIGTVLAYHNETSEESQSKPGELEALYKETNPEYVSFILDCGHAYQGGMNVPQFFCQHQARIVGLHLRDYKDGHQVRLGEGTFPLAQLAAAVRQAQWKGWVMNEEERLDGTKHGSEYMAPAYRAMLGAFSL